MRMARSSKTMAWSGACRVIALSAWAKSNFAAEFLGGVGVTFAGLGWACGLLLLPELCPELCPELARLSETPGLWLPAHPPIKITQSREIQSFMFTSAHTVR